jgi:hypothetical protein
VDFTPQDEQKHFFSLSPEEKFNLKTFHALSSRIYFILQFGYFKSHQMFFAFNYKKNKPPPWQATGY